MSHHYRTSSRDFSSRQKRMWRRNQNTVAFAPTVALGPISNTILITLMVTVLGIIYVTQVTKTGTYGYDIDGRNEKLTALKFEKEDLENENARLQSLKDIASSDVAKAMVKPESVEYARN